LRTAGDADD
jgi:low temperature requirement protein LtrA